MGILPFLAFSYKGKAYEHTILPNMPELCKETGGDCFAWVNKYLIINWRQWDEKTSVIGGYVFTTNGRQCTKEEINNYGYDYLYICPP
jgi:hypothetical protein